MVDFRKKLGAKQIDRTIHPCKIYENLDRESDKGPLRPVQEQILSDWYDKYRGKKDVILKLHTGQGKTLIGLLILQSRLNQNTGPAIYLCPDI
ncbi:DEAD/DEAH box helicase family protein [Desulfitobacterium sp. Sab5]|uniref:DEAD/DEAH box helicase family protein n=1 Tax=Desulfitobacterium nosdiversum TaxID=3375356 RepID=UPI003CF07158